MSPNTGFKLLCSLIYFSNFLNIHTGKDHDMNLFNALLPWNDGSWTLYMYMHISTQLADIILIILCIALAEFNKATSNCRIVAISSNMTAIQTKEQDSLDCLSIYIVKQWLPVLYSVSSSYFRKFTGFFDGATKRTVTQRLMENVDKIIRELFTWSFT